MSAVLLKRLARWWLITRIVLLLCALCWIGGEARLQLLGIGDRNPGPWQDYVISPALAVTWDFLAHPFCHPWDSAVYPGSPVLPMPVRYMRIPGDLYAQEDTGHGSFSNFINVDFLWQKVVILSAYPTNGGKPPPWHIGWGSSSYCNVVLVPGQKVGMLLGRGDATFFAFGDGSFIPLSLRIAGFATRAKLPPGVVLL